MSKRVNNKKGNRAKRKNMGGHPTKVRGQPAHVARSKNAVSPKPLPTSFEELFYGTH